MCGIMGYVVTKPELFTPTKKYTLILAKNLLETIFERGGDATGYLAHYNNTHKTIYYKRPLSALTFIRRGYMDFKIMPNVLIGHARAATTGSPSHNVNNHPLFCGDYGLVHNGHISQWLTHTKYTLSMQTRTDSELLVIYMAEQKGNLTKMASVFPSASFALAAMHIKNGLVTLVCDETVPLHYVDLSQHLGIILFASTESNLRAALNRTFRQYPAFTIQSCKAHTAYTVSVKGLKTAYTLAHTAYVPQQSYVNWQEYFAEKNQIQRVELEIQELFRELLGADDYRYHLAQFARQYYYTGIGWLDRPTSVNQQLAERFIEDIWERYEEHEGHTSY